MLRHHATALILLVASACTDVELRPVSRPAQVQGTYCTDNADTYDLPIRILLVIDTSASMTENDENGGRARAAADLVTHFSGHDNVSFGFIGFNTAASRLTEGFANDPAVIAAALEQLNTAEGYTNYLDALAVAEGMVTDDIAEVAAELDEMVEKGQSTRFARPWYFVIFLSDGIPRMSGGVLQDTNQILWRVDELVDVPKEAAGLSLHTAFLGAENDSQRPAAEALLGQMADAGGGTYTSFESGDEIDFTVFDFEIIRMYDIKEPLIYNRSGILGEMTVMPDSDMDGVMDLEEERELGTDPFNRDTDGDGCLDGFERYTGLDPLNGGYCPCDAGHEEDSDGDGLLDCEELFLGYDPEMFDTDGDLLPDGLEYRMGTNGLDGGDWKEDLDFDGVPSGKEIRQGTIPIRDDRELHDKYGYRYRLTRTSGIGAPQTCYVLSIDNIGLARTEATEVQEAGVNELVIELVESPEDAPQKIFTLRRLVVHLEHSRTEEPTLTFSAEEFETVSTQEICESRRTN